MTEKTILYEFCYNSDTCESVGGTVSIHFSEAGAIKAMEEHKAEEYKKFLEFDNQCKLMDPEFTAENPNVFGSYEDWYVREIEVLP
ncbi:MAG: hypothetical protein WC979_02975 [Candidatus Pacearchaeota archaeon]|jgi:hypothetical protein|nr:hypothetical protein [Clostridia bacterium]